MPKRPTHCCTCQAKLFRNGDCPCCNQWVCPECVTVTPVGSALAGCPRCQKQRWDAVTDQLNEILDAPRYDKPG